MAAARLQHKIGNIARDGRVQRNPGASCGRDLPMGRHLVLAVAVLLSGAFLLSTAAVAQQALPAGSLAIKVLAEKKVAALPAGRATLSLLLENFPTLSL